MSVSGPYNPKLSCAYGINALSYIHLAAGFHLSFSSIPLVNSKGA